MKIGRGFAIPAAIGLAVLAAVLIARMWEPEDVGRHDPAYWLAIPQAARSLPLFEACTAPRYGLVRQDGLRPRLASVRYRTTLPPAVLLGRYRAALEEKGCTVDDGDGTLLAGRCAPPFDHAELDIAVSGPEDGSGCAGVTVSVVGG